MHVCEHCRTIDIKIARYRGIAKGVYDKRALEAADKLIAELEAQKSALHTER